MKAVRRMLIHSSIAELKRSGLFERYCSLIDPSALAEITDLIGPGWLPLALAMMHYDACERLELDGEVLAQLGARAGEKIQSSLLVSMAKTELGRAARSPWDAIGALWRMGRRLYDGGSSQYVKIRERELLIETIENPLFATRYYRTAHQGFLRSSISALGARITQVRPEYHGDTAAVRIAWE